MKLLDDDISWDLLSKKVFGQEVCPLRLEDCGKRIAKGCRGLPLALVVIGGLLKTSGSTLEYWEYVANNISSVISGEDNERCLDILSLSYHQLPIHLKPCFLYMATYPEDHEIKISDVIKLWAADGFLKPNAKDLPEETAKKYLNNLIDRNLLTKSYKLSPYGNISCVKMHDLVRELSISEAKKGGFIHVNGDSLDTMEKQRRLVVHDDREFSLIGKGSARSLIFFNTSCSSYDVSCSRLLRVLFAPSQKLPGDIVQLVNLRFLRLSIGEYPFWWLLSSSTSKLWNLETLIMDGNAGTQANVLPCDIWKLRHMKHLIFGYPGVILPDPPSSEFVLEKLETLYYVQNLSDKVLNNIPNIKHLMINNRKRGKRDPIPNMVQSHKLETLKIEALEINLKSQMFPGSIRELTLWYVQIPWGSMTHVGSLPNLESLNICYEGFNGKKWTTREGEFQSLKYLTISCSELVRWRTWECSHFPTLEHLYLLNMVELKEIPQCFGESMTLESIELIRCPDIVVRSAKRILEEQHSSNGNDQFTLEIDHELYSRPQNEEGAEDESDEDDEDEDEDEDDEDEDDDDDEGEDDDEVKTCPSETIIIMGGGITPG